VPPSTAFFKWRLELLELYGPEGLNLPKLHFGAHAHEHVGSVACLAGVAAETAERSMIEFIKKAVRISDHFNNDAAFVKAQELRDLMHMCQGNAESKVPACLQYLDVHNDMEVAREPLTGAERTCVMDISVGHCQRARQHKLTEGDVGSLTLRVGSLMTSISLTDINVSGLDAWQN